MIKILADDFVTGTDDNGKTIHIAVWKGGDDEPVEIHFTREQAGVIRSSINTILSTTPHKGN